MSLTMTNPRLRRTSVPSRATTRGTSAKCVSSSPIDNHAARREAERIHWPQVLSVFEINGLVPMCSFANGSAEFAVKVFSLVATFLVARALTITAHEVSHFATARFLGWHDSSISLPFLSLGHPQTKVPGLNPARAQASIVRHAGWCFSLALALFVCTTCSSPTAFAATLTALDALSSDFFGAQPDGYATAAPSGSVFFCGNFGVLLLNGLKGAKVLELLRQMLRVTMVRGAQSAGLVTYKPRNGSSVGVRSRVVNGKRTDLSHLLLRKFKSALGGSAVNSTNTSPQLFQGHTRFATSSICNLSGCHPHQWTPPQRLMHWQWGKAEARYVGAVRNVEGYITHNGDLDFFSVNGSTLPLPQLQGMLSRVLGQPMPSDVDSVCIAGLLDLLRTKGLWGPSVRYAFVFSALKPSGVNKLAAELASLKKILDAVAQAFEEQWAQLLMSPPTDVESGEGLITDEASAVARLSSLMEKRMLELVVKRASLTPLVESLEALLPPVSNDRGVPEVAHRNLVVGAVQAFFHQDLLKAGFDLMKGSMGSFGLVLSHSLDADKEAVFAARGQTMSVAFYPSAGFVMFGSESAATKVGLGLSEEESAGSFRFDLDDVVGEVLLLRWGENEADVESRRLAASRGTSASGGDADTKLAEIFRYGQDSSFVLSGANFLENKWHHPLQSRKLQLAGNPLVDPLPEITVADPIGRDILELPDLLRAIKEDFADPSHESLNRITAWTFTNKLRQRLLKRQRGEADDSIDLLIIGCEVSLWVGEQFAADMRLVFPKLKILALSSNKLLGQLGQMMPIPQIGFQVNEATLNLTNTVVLGISHSGGTFGTLAGCNLLRSYTHSIFVVTSEWDTQVARAVRIEGEVGEGVELRSQFVFSTGCGVRTAEPCTITVAATHHLLTQLLMFVMGYLARFETKEKLGGSSYEMEEVQELELLNRALCGGLREIVGDGRFGTTSTSRALRQYGRRWAWHVLEAPISWIVSAIYILVTVMVTTPLVAIVEAAIGQPLPAFDDEAEAWLVTVKYIVNVADSVIYAFLPWWTTVAIRLVQQRPWLHRVAGRSILIGDVPWVAQSVEAFASKTFALAYSIATASVASANPNDHLVHRHTHRVVRGSLLVVGRPDGRLSSLTTAEAACCLSVNQASSIQNLGVTCESLTIGHNPFTLPLSTAAIKLPTVRPPFFCEMLLPEDTNSTTAHGSSYRGTTFAFAAAMAARELGGSAHSRNAFLSYDNGFRSREGSTHGGAAQLRLTMHNAAPAADADMDNKAASVHGGHLMRAQQNPSENKAASVHGGTIGLSMETRAHELTFRKPIETSMPLAQFPFRAYNNPTLAHGHAPHHDTAAASGPVSPLNSVYSGNHFGHLKHKEAYFAPNQLATMLAGGSAAHDADGARESREHSQHAGSRGKRSTQFFAAFAGHAPEVPTSPEAARLSHNGSQHGGSRGRGAANFFTSITNEALFRAGVVPPPPPPPPAETAGEKSADACAHKSCARHKPLWPFGGKASTQPPADAEEGQAALGGATSGNGSSPFGCQTGPAKPGLSAVAEAPSKSVKEESSKYGHAGADFGAAPNTLRANLDRFAGRNGHKQLARAVGGAAHVQVVRPERFVIEPLVEPFIGAWMHRRPAYNGLNAGEVMKRQQLVQLLCESRFDSLQRLVSFFVMFHALGKLVQDFWPTVSLGLLHYDMSRSQSIMRVATTASPVSGMEVRDRMLEIVEQIERERAAALLQKSWRSAKLVTRAIRRMHAHA